MYIRYTQPPGDLYDWYEEYLQDEEEVDAKAGGGQVTKSFSHIFIPTKLIFIHFQNKKTMTIGQMLHQWLVKLDWFSTLFPRIPVPIQKQIESKLAAYSRIHNVNLQAKYASTAERSMDGGSNNATAAGSSFNNKRTDTREYYDRNRDSSSSGSRQRDRDVAAAPPPPPSYRSNEHDRRYRSRSRSKDRSSYSGGGDRGYKDRYRDNRDNRSDYYAKEKSDRKTSKEYYRDGESSSRHYDDNRHRDRDRKYR